MRRRKPHPLAPHVVYMRKNRHDATPPARRSRSPSSSLEPLNNHLIHALIHQKYLRRSGPKAAPHAFLSTHRCAPTTLLHDRHSNSPCPLRLCGLCVKAFS
jgi:hypothetical protein